MGKPNHEASQMGAGIDPDDAVHGTRRPALQGRPFPQEPDGSKDSEEKHRHSPPRNFHPARESRSLSLTDALAMWQGLSLASSIRGQGPSDAAG